MTIEETKDVLRRMAAACAKIPTPGQAEVMIEAIADHGITSVELKRGYLAVRDAAAAPWWPSPGQFLRLCRPGASAVVVGGEAETIFDLLISRPTDYGSYNPHTGVVYDRRKVESIHGVAAGMAFGAVATRFRNLETESVPFVRRDFVAAYAASRADHGAPLTLSPSRGLPPAQDHRGAITGAAPDSAQAAPGEQERRFRELVSGFGLSLDFRSEPRTERKPNV